MRKNKQKIEKYDPKVIESKWREIWKKEGIYKFKEDSAKPHSIPLSGTSRGKYYPLVELPYPSGDLHIGHWFSFATADVHARLHKMMGKNVFFTNGFDAFGLPAENAAIKRGVHPKDWTMSNIATMRKQFDQMGTMIDWSYETITCLPEYYKWNQWIFIEMFKRGLAYRAKALTNWCPKDMTVLANENIENGKCWRCGSEVIQKEVEQWFIRLTAYADELIWPDSEALSVKRQGSSNRNEKNKKLNASRFTLDARNVDWPMSVKVAQNQWIGKKEGVKIKYQILPSRSARPMSNTSIALSATNTTNEFIEVFTTRPDTNFGATFIALAPEYPFVEKIIKGQIQVPGEKLIQMKDYVEKAKRKTELERQTEAREKTGVFTGLYAVNQLTGSKMPIWISDFVLIGFGTGALVGVPGHDKRDFQFARKFNLDIKRVVVGADNDRSPITKIEQVQENEGTMVNSGFLNGLDIHSATKKIIEYLVTKGWAEKVVTYHIHDWSISRQRYWGTPVPMIHCERCGIVPVPENQLPVELPYDVDFTPKGEPPLASNKKWLAVECPKCGGKARRDPETLDTFFDSSWYFYRYVDPHYDKGPFPARGWWASGPDRLTVQDLLPVDIYFGGAEHTLGHTLYARFFTRFFKQLGLVDFEEFAKKRVQHGVILGPDGNRMSKSKGNVINPDDVVKEYGADAVRLYLCFMMPYDATAPWNPGGMWGVYRFLKRVWDLRWMLEVRGGNVEEEVGSKREEYLKHQRSKLKIQPPASNFQPQGAKLSQKDLYEMHSAIKKVGEDAGSTKFNTALSTLMKWLNYLEAKGNRQKAIVTLEEYKTFLLLLAPFAPHMTEELWDNFSTTHKPQPTSWSIHQQSWPMFDKKHLVEDRITIVIQVNGKVRDNMQIETAREMLKNEIQHMAMESDKVKRHLEGKSIKKVIYIPGKILNFVI